ncbi:MAG: hypothetical protein MZV63_38755 [Marinilabiliales bacterium]|nr:hypothetical protein [Marinilabiliales bacterium]
MKKILSALSALVITGSLFAGGLVTNTNQSAYMVRMLSRQASTGVDAAYFNPAGLTKLADGFHFSLNNQTIGQTKTITNDYYFLTEKPTEYVGKVSAPFFPGIYAVYKTGKLATLGRVQSYRRRRRRRICHRPSITLRPRSPTWFPDCSQQLTQLDQGVSAR